MTLLEKRRNMMAKGPSIDWESIARGMCDCTTEFSIPAELELNAVYGAPNRKGLISAVCTQGSSVGQNAFVNCSKLKSVTFPDTVTSFGNYALQSCTSLEEVILYSTTPPTLGTKVFNYITKQFIIYVPDESVDTYKESASWSTYESRIKGISERP